MYWYDDNLAISGLLTFAFLGFIVWKFKVPLLRLFQPESAAGWTVQMGITALMLGGAMVILIDSRSPGEFTAFDLGFLLMMIYIWARGLYFVLMRPANASEQG